MQFGVELPEVSQVLNQIGTKFRRLPHVFGVRIFNDGVGDFVYRAVQLQIQYGGQKVGKTEMSASRRL